LLDKGGLILMTTDPQATLLSPHPDVTGGALRAPLGPNASLRAVFQAIVKNLKNSFEARQLMKIYASWFYAPKVLVTAPPPG
jgi:hypothetical protein